MQVTRSMTPTKITAIKTEVPNLVPVLELSVVARIKLKKKKKKIIKISIT